MFALIRRGFKYGCVVGAVGLGVVVAAWNGVERLRRPDVPYVEWYC